MIPTRSILAGLFYLAFFQAVYSLASYQSFEHSVADATSKVENRLALDLPKLRLANPKFNTVAHVTSIQEYIRSLNEQLKQLNAPIRLTQLQNVQQMHDVEGTNKNFVLNTSDRNIQVGVLILNQSWHRYLSFYPILAALLSFVMLAILQRASAARAKQSAALDTLPVEPKLIINLHDKTIANGIDDKASPLSNKPFCFYMALLQYCLDNPSPKLNHNKNVPDELIALANKYFYRLIELGHTKRKRPDFSTNLDKTLSEIRAALDEVFHDYPEEKDKYYPPKAQGEGSRSKLHNYALEHLNKEKMQFIGK